MALQLGIQLASSQTNNYLTDAKYVRGGYLVVDSIADIDARWYDEGEGGVLVEGSLCYDISSEKFYRYSGENKAAGWIELEFATYGDDVTIELDSNNKLTLKGFSTAQNKQVPTKDTSGNLVWENVSGLIPEAIVPVGDNETINVAQKPDDETKYVVSIFGKDGAADKAVFRKHIVDNVVSYTWDVVYSTSEVDALLADKQDTISVGDGLKFENNKVELDFTVIDCGSASDWTD